jgi:hypothetical protein
MSMKFKIISLIMCYVIDLIFTITTTLNLSAFETKVIFSLAFIINLQIVTFLNLKKEWYETRRNWI